MIALMIWILIPFLFLNKNNTQISPNPFFTGNLIECACFHSLLMLTYDLGLNHKMRAQ
jgi:hypothetical protein